MLLGTRMKNAFVHSPTSLSSQTPKSWQMDTLSEFPLFFCILYCWFVAKAAKNCSQPWLTSWKQFCWTPSLLWIVLKNRLGWEEPCLLISQVTSSAYSEYFNQMPLLPLKDLMGRWAGDSFSSSDILLLWRISHCKGSFRCAVLHKESGALS